MTRVSHGGRDPGAIGPTGLKEKDVTLAVAKQVAAFLRPSFEVSLTRETDKHFAETLAADLRERGRIVNASGADVCVSIHCNAADSPQAHGTEAWIHPDKPQDKPLAEAILARLVAFTGLTNRGVDGGNLAMVRYPKMPACLVEMAFISNPAEEAMLRDPTFQGRCARAIAEGIAAWAGVSLKGEDSLIKGVPENHWAYKSYLRMREAGMIAGDAQGVMHPDDPVTEARFVVFMDRLIARLDLDDKIKALVERYKSGVVEIRVTHRQYDQEWKSLGSGSFITEDGYILTNKHVTDFGKVFEVVTVFGTFPGRFVCNAGAMMAEDSSVDLAIIKVDLPAGVKPARIPWRYEQPAKGEFVIVMGSPLGETGTVNFGMVSNSQKDEWIQVDAPINPGNSGGICLLVDEGVAIGVPTQKYGGEWVDNMGFLTPGDVVKRFLDEKFKK